MMKIKVSNFNFDCYILIFNISMTTGDNTDIKKSTLIFHLFCTLGFDKPG